MSFRKVIRKIHLFLGLASGLVVLTIAITGCCWVFKEEIKSLTQDKIEIRQQSKPIITPSQAKEYALDIFPGKQLHGVLFDDITEPVEVIFYEEEPLFYSSVFLNPFDGTVLKTENHLSGFFAFVLDGHINLWLPEKIGRQLVRWSCVVFTFMLVSGIILWWPRNKLNRKQRFTFKWKPTTKWRRKNYDIHAIFGFYSSIFALIIVLTALIMAFPAVKDSIYYLAGGKKSTSFSIPFSKTKTNESVVKPIDKLLNILQKTYPKAKDFEIHYPHTDSSAIYVEISYSEDLYYNSDYRYYDQNTLEELPSTTIYGTYENTHFSDKLMRMNYDIHIGAILGLPGKILAFITSLTIGSLPITGFIIWRGRK